MTNGQILEVHITSSGDELATAHPAGATTITLMDLDDFPSDVGDIEIYGTVYAYSAVDREALTMTLDTPLVEDYEETEPVYSWPRNEEKWAMVETQFDDPFEAVVPYDLYDRIDDGVREPEDQEDVTLEMRNGEWFVLNVHGQEPVINSRYLDNADSQPGPDGNPPPPVEFLVATGGIGAIFLSWDPVLNADPVTYDVHMGLTEDFVIGAGSFYVAYTKGSTFTVRDLGFPGSNPLEYGTTYYFRIEAWDSDGPAEASPVASAQMMQVTGPDVAANYVYAGTVVANQVIGGTFQSDLLLSGTIKTATEGARVTLGAAGVKVYNPSGVETTVLGSDGVSTFKGTGEFTNLTATGSVALRKDTEISKAAVVTMESATTASAAAPTVATDWEELVLTGTPEEYLSSPIRNMQRDSASSEWWVFVAYTQPSAQFVLRLRYSSAGTYLGYDYRLGSSTGVGGIRLGADEFTLIWSGGSTPYALYRSSGAGTNLIALVPKLNTNGQLPTIGTDGTNILIAEIDSSDQKATVRKYSPTGTLLSTRKTGGGWAQYGPLFGVQEGNFDFGSSRVVFGTSSNLYPDHYRAMTTSGSTFNTNTTEIFPAAPGAVAGAWNGSNFYSLTSDFVLHRHEDQSTSVAWPTDETWQAGYTWRNTLGSYETPVSPLRAFTMRNRTRVVVTSAEFPEGVDAIGVYLGKTATRTAMYLQGESPDGQHTIYDPVFTGTNPPDPASNPAAFPSATPGKIVSAGLNGSNSSQPTIELTGDGSGRIGYKSWDEKGEDSTPFATGSQSASLAITTAAYRTMTYDTVVINNGITYSAGVWTVEHPGRYAIDAVVTILPQAGGRRIGAIYIDDAMYVRFDGPGSSAYPDGGCLSTTVWLEAGQQISIRAYQNSGSTVGTQIGTYSNRVSIAMV